MVTKQDLVVEEVFVFQIKKHVTATTPLNSTMSHSATIVETLQHI